MDYNKRMWSNLPKWRLVSNYQSYTNSYRDSGSWESGKGMDEWQQRVDNACMRDNNDWTISSLQRKFSHQGVMFKVRLSTEIEFVDFNAALYRRVMRRVPNRLPVKTTFVQLMFRD